MFDFKMNFSHKYRSLLEAHKMPSLVGHTCAGIVIRDKEIIKITFTFDALNRLDSFLSNV